MKKIISLFSAVILISTFFGCASTDGVQYSNPTEYVEFESWEIRTNNEFQNQAYHVKGFKLTDRELKVETAPEGKYLLVNGMLLVNIQNYLKKNPDFPERIELNRKYTICLSYIQDGNFITGYTFTPVLDDIENLRTIEEIEEEKAAELAKKQAEKEAKEQKQKELELKAQKIAEGYIYHGFDEAKQNALLFTNGALQPGNAYYIDMFQISNNNSSLAAAPASIFATLQYQYVKYADQKVRGEVTSAAITAIGNWPVKVVVLGGDAPLYTPIVLGLVE